MQSISIHIGLNKVDSTQYYGWQGDLRACEADARAMVDVAKAAGIAKSVLLATSDATYARVKAEFETAASVLGPDDYLLVTFSGHGAWFDDIPMAAASDVGGRPEADDIGDEDDGRDEAWCLYDTCVLDDELHAWFCKFAAGVRICTVSDSCFSGTVTRSDEVGGFLPRHPGQSQRRVRHHGAAASRSDPDNPKRPHDDFRHEPAEVRERQLTPELARALYRRNFLTVYQPRRLAVAGSRTRQPGAHIVLLAACGDLQTASEGNGHGRFTEQLLRTWNGGQYRGSHREFIERIKAAMPQRQQPCLFISGKPSIRFLDCRPFTPGH